MIPSARLNRRICLEIIDEVLKMDLSKFKDLVVSFRFYNGEGDVGYRIVGFDGAIHYLIHYLFALSDRYLEASEGSNVLAVASLRRARTDEGYRLSDAANRKVLLEVRDQVVRWRDYVYLLECFFPLHDSEVPHFVECSGRFEARKSGEYKSLHLYYRCDHGFEKHVANIWPFSPWT